MLLVVLVIVVVVPLPIMLSAVLYPCPPRCVGVGGVSLCGVTSRCCHSTCNLPHKRLLVRLEAGGILSIVVVGLGAVVLVACWHWRSSSRVACPSIAPPVPPCEQVARGSGGVCCHCRRRSTRNPPHEQSLVGREVGGGLSWCPDAVQCRYRVIAPTIYPASSCTLA